MICFHPRWSKNDPNLKVRDQNDPNKKLGAKVSFQQNV